MNTAVLLPHNPTPATHTRRRFIIMLLSLALLGMGLIGFHLFKTHILKQVGTQIRSELPTVATAVATVQSWQPSLAAVGTLRASNGADLSAEIGGIVEDIHFESGKDVRAGDLLVQLRLNDDEAKLGQLKAIVDLDRITYERDKQQLGDRAIAQSTVDTDSGNLASAREQFRAQQAVIAEKFIRAPFAGTLGVRQVDRGQYLSPGTAIVTLQALDPIFIDFYLPQQAVAQIHAGQAVTVSNDAYPDRRFSGTVLAVNPKVDSGSRMVQVRASLHNADHALLPGMFANATIDSGHAQSQVTIPQSAVSYNPYGSLVYLLEPDGQDEHGKSRQKVRQQFVVTGAARGDQIAITKGVVAGDVVVTSGQLKLHNDASVLIDNKVEPSNDADPKPVDQ
jgi:membrane fusion protein (multidrug efflux system)